MGVNTKVIHKQYNTVKEYLEAILKGKYYYSIEDIADHFDMKQQYIQVNYIDRLDTIYIDPENKKELRHYINLFYNGLCDEIPQDTRELIKMFIPYKDILRKKILISGGSIDNLTLNIFKKYVAVKDPTTGKIKKDDKGKVIYSIDPLDPEDLKTINSNQLYNTRSLMLLYECNFNTQLYRKLKRDPHIKLMLLDPNNNINNKASNTRYILL